jgi:hypothetical protein
MKMNMKKMKNGPWIYYEDVLVRISMSVIGLNIKYKGYMPYT